MESHALDPIIFSEFPLVGYRVVRETGGAVSLQLPNSFRVQGWYLLDSLLQR